jgi:hypothetical protein
MNTGIQDAYNLAWKLALVLQNKAHSMLLDTYEEERRPIGEQLLRDTETNSAVTLGANPMTRFIRDHFLMPLTRLPALQQKATKRGAQLDIHYRASRLSHSSRSSGEKQGAYGLHFAPQAGDRAPDGAPLYTIDHNVTSLFQEMRGTTWHLLLFGGIAQANPHRLIELTQQVENYLGKSASEIQPLLIINGQQPLAERNWSGTVLFDPEGLLHQRYKAKKQTLYLVRPDGYIGFRSQSITQENLFSYLESIFQA